MHVHLLDQDNIRGRALLALLQNNNHKVNLTSLKKKKSDINQRPKQHILVLVHTHLLLNINARGVKDIGNNQDAILMIGELEYLHLLIKFRVPIKGFISNQAKPAQLFETISKLNSRQSHLGKITRNYLKKTKIEKQNILLENQIKKPLTKTELKIMMEISAGISSRNIAEKWHRSIHTINNHRKNIKTKIKQNHDLKLSEFCFLQNHAIKSLVAMNENKLLG